MITAKPDEAQIRAQLAALIPPSTTGFLVVVLPTDPRISPATGKYEHRHWGPELKFAWPAERDVAVREILKAATLGDAYLCTYVMKSRRRSPDEATARKLLHVDHDGGNLDIAEVRRLGCFAYSSGSAGNGHVYARLKHAITPAQYEILAKGLIAHFHGDPAKWRENDVLRIAGTFSFKPTIRTPPEPPTPVAELVPFSRELDPFVLAKQVRVDISTPTGAAASGTKTTAPPKGSRPHTEPIDWDDEPAVRKALNKKTGDRSHDTYRIIGVCVDNELTLPQTRWVIDQRPDLAARITEMFARSTPWDDVANSYNTIQARWKVSG